MLHTFLILATTPKGWLQLCFMHVENCICRQEVFMPGSFKQSFVHHTMLPPRASGACQKSGQTSLPHLSGNRLLGGRLRWAHPQILPFGPGELGWGVTRLQDRYRGGRLAVCWELGPGQAAYGGSCGSPWGRGQARMQGAPSPRARGSQAALPLLLGSAQSTG